MSSLLRNARPRRPRVPLQGLAGRLRLEDGSAPAAAVGSSARLLRARRCVRFLSQNYSESTPSASGERKGSDAAQPGASRAPPTAPSTTAAAYLDLAKAKLSALVVTTAAAGFVAAGGPLSPQLHVLGACLLGTGLCSASAAAGNQILEASRDARMRRTQHRPLVTGALTEAQAVRAAALWGAAGTAVLYVGTDPTTAALGAGNLALYAGLYTYLKPRSVLNTWVGAVVGAVPPLMGYCAATQGAGLLDAEALVLAGTLYLWQLPHFFALSYCSRADYRRGNFRMVACRERAGEETARLVTRYTWYLSAMPIVATLAGCTSSMFALEGAAMNAYALHVAHRFDRHRTNQNARKVFLTSLWYLPSFLMLFLLHSKKWDDEKEDDPIAKAVWDQIHRIRERGKELCLHEVVANKTEHGEEACPVSVGQKKGREGMEVATEVVGAAATVETVQVPAGAGER